MDSFTIREIKARQVLDSRGNPTVEAEVWLENGGFGRAIVPSGASTGSSEALELRDGDTQRFGGKGVLKAVWNINSKIRDVLVGNTSDPEIVDSLLIDLDGNKNKANLGANAVLAVSLANAKANAYAHHMPFYRYIGELAGTDEEMSLPMPMMNVINGGAHDGWTTDFQEYMIIPVSAATMLDAVRMGTEVFHQLASVLESHGYPTTVGDEGGYAPNVHGDDNAPLYLIKEAVEQSGYQLGRDIAFAMDVAASEFYTEGHYVLKTNGDWKTPDDLINWYTWMADNFPMLSIEDGLDENDWANWRVLTERLGHRMQLVGDDLFVTNTNLLDRGIRELAGNAILIKPNQIGTLTETIDAVLMAKDAGYRTIISHRSGETEDVSIAHLAVGLGAGQIKTGSLSRSERIAKYNELMRIAETNPQLKLENPFAQS